MIKNELSNFGIICKYEGIGFRKLSEMTGLGKSNIANYMHGKSKPSIESALLMSKILGYSIEEMFGDELPPDIRDWAEKEGGEEE